MGARHVEDVYEDGDDDDDDKEQEGAESKEEEVEAEEEEDEEEDEEEEEEDDEEEEVDYKQLLREAVQRVEHSGAFAGGAKLAKSMPRPALSVEGVGRLAFPLQPAQARSLIAAATQAPYGKGEATVTDPAVRRTWQVDAGRVTIKPAWDKHLKTIVDKACKQLALDPAALGVQARLYKLLLYEKGGHFKRHRDTEKEPGMFGTLIVQLPALHTGGDLVVEHGGITKRFAFADQSDDHMYYVALYADCEHTLEPVTSGLRLALVYNLVRTGAGPAPMASDSGIVNPRLAQAAHAWAADRAACNKFLLPLKHKYTQWELSFQGLKGEDAKMVGMLRLAADPRTNKKLFAVHLILLEKTELGDAEVYSDNEMDDFDVGHDGRVASVEHDTLCWIDDRGQHNSRLEQVILDFEDEVLTGEAEDDLFGKEPDGFEYEGYTGNEGAPFSRWYQTALAVIVPRKRLFRWLCKEALDEAVARMEPMRARQPELFAKRLAALLAIFAASTKFSRDVSLRGSDDVDLRLGSMLSLCNDSLPRTLELLAIMGKTPPLEYSGIRGAATTTQLVKAVETFGWAALGDAITQVVRASTDRMVLLAASFVLRLADNEPAAAAALGPILLHQSDGLRLDDPLSCTALLHVCFQLPNALADMEAFARRLPSQLRPDGLGPLLSSLNLAKLQPAALPALAILARPLTTSAPPVVYGPPTPAAFLTALGILLRLEQEVPGFKDFGLVTAFQQTLSALQDNEKILAVILHAPNIVAALRAGNEPVMQLCHQYIALLPTPTVVPDQSWRMPAVPTPVAPATHVAQLRAFLDDDAPTAVLTGFGGLRNAKYFAEQVQRSYGLQAAVNGRAAAATCTVTKTQASRVAQQKAYKEAVKEKKGLEKLLAEGEAAAAQSARAKGAAKPAKGPSTAAAASAAAAPSKEKAAEATQPKAKRAKVEA